MSLKIIILLIGLANTAFSAELPQQWQDLLRYKNSLFGQESSEVDTAEFFLTPEGANDMAQEWDHSQIAFFSAPPDQSPAMLQNHPVCLFPARAIFLSNYLHRPLGVDLQKCERFQKMLTKLNLDRAYLVFAGQYVQHPASAFGHSFFRLRPKENTTGNAHLDYGVDYAATVTTTNPIVYGILGITGGFWGYFSLMPYYVKIRQYNDLDRRDLWEYEIPLTEDQKIFFVAHLLEMERAGFDYFYFTENCSYHILRFLDAVIPGANLSARLHPVVIPADSISAFHKQFPEVVPVYRSGPMQELPALLARLSNEEKILFNHWARDLRSNSMAPYPLQSPEGLKLGLTFFDAHFADDLALPNSLAATEKLKIATKLAMTAKSQAGLLSKDNLDQNKPFAPHEAIGTRRLGLHSRLYEKGQAVESLFSYRWSLSSWDEWARARLPHTTLEMGELILGIRRNLENENYQNTKKNEFYFDHFHLLNIVNRNPVSALAPDLSWDFGVGLGDVEWTRKREISPDAHLRLGLSVELGPFFLSGYVSSEVDRVRLPTVSRWEMRLGPRIEAKLKLNEGLHLTGLWSYHKTLWTSRPSQVHLMTLATHYAFNNRWAVKITAQKQRGQTLGELALFHSF